MKKKIALVTGITGQDGSLIADFLLNKNYKVIGMKRRSSSFNTQRIDHLYKDFQEKNDFIPFSKKILPSLAKSHISQLSCTIQIILADLDRKFTLVKDCTNPLVTSSPLIIIL